MTSYSTYGTSRINLVDAALNIADGSLAGEFEDICNTVAAGAARALLDQARDLADLDAEVSATDWHSAESGWEVDAIHDDDRNAFRELAERFVRENLGNVLALTERIAWHDDYAGELWHGDTGMALYRVGMLLGHTRAGTGIGFADYAERQCQGFATELTGQLESWASNNVPCSWEQSYIDSNESPCRLHLS